MGSDKTRQQQVINLRREFENLKMKESETIKQYSDRIMATVNNIRLLGEDFSDSRVVEKVITTLPEREEQVGRRRVLKVLFKQRSEKAPAQVRKLRSLGLKRGKDQRKMPVEGGFHHAFTARRLIIWRSILGLDWTYNYKSHKYGHHEKISRSHEKAQAQPVQAKSAVDVQAQEEHVFTASCFAANSKSSWLVDSGCSHHMAADESLFKNIDRSYVSKVRIGNGNLIEAKGRGDVVIHTGSGNKIISDVLYVPEIDQNLLSVGQLVKKGFSLVFKNDSCVISDAHGREIVSAPIGDKCFMLWM
ncbi:uncharacterized protein LOC128040605 [Gossypium raimondii]|uniref:uncharacterized protein LOC128040605 n=1 Tax=Gossypium raimondii TaxID=29730 RepID=UPI00227AF919|nr:uncharacterized protein LOC128040605 [Gossypium raimondii]